MASSGLTEATGKYASQVVGDRFDKDKYSLDVTNAQTFNGKKLKVPRGDFVAEFTASPSDWNHLSTDIDLQVTTKTNGHTSSFAHVHVVIDPVLVPLTPGYRIVAKAPAALSAKPLLRTVSATNVKAGRRVTLSGAGFGAARGKVILRPADTTRIYRVEPMSWRNDRVVVRLPNNLPGGRVWVSLRAGKTKNLTNALPLSVARHSS